MFTSVLTYVVSKWRECLIAALAVTICILYLIWPVPAVPTVQIQERIVEKQVEVIKTVYAKSTEKSKVTTTEGGKTVIVETEKVAEVAKTAAASNKTVDYSAKVSDTVYTPPAYSIGITVDIDRNYRLIGGARLGSSPFSGIVEYEPRKNTFSAGILYQF